MVYSKLLIGNIPWALLTPSTVGNQQAFTVDTDFSRIARPAFSLQHPRQSRGKGRSSPTIGDRKFIISSAARELSLNPIDGAMLLPSISAVNLRSSGGTQINPVSAATRRRALGTLKSMMSTQKGATLIKGTQHFLTQTGTIGLRDPKNGGRKLEFQKGLESLLSDLAETATADQSINADLWEGWILDHDKLEVNMDTKRLQGVLLGRRNRILEEGVTEENTKTTEPVLMWDVVSDNYSCAHSTL